MRPGVSGGGKGEPSTGPSCRHLFLSLSLSFFLLSFLSSSSTSPPYSSVLFIRFPFFFGCKYLPLTFFTSTCISYLAFSSLHIRPGLHVLVHFRHKEPKIKKKKEKEKGRTKILKRSPPTCGPLVIFMGFFDHLQKGGSFSLQPKKPQIRKVVQTRPAAPSRSSSQTPNSAPPRVSSTDKTRHSRSQRSSASRDSEPPASKRRLGTPLRSRKRQTPELRLSSDDDDDDASDTDASFEVRKRARTSDSAEPDLERRVRSLKAFTEDAVKALPMVHAAEITSVQKPGNFQPAFGQTDQPAEVLLQYPSASPKERYGPPFPLPPLLLSILMIRLFLGTSS